MKELFLTLVKILKELFMSIYDSLKPSS